MHNKTDHEIIEDVKAGNSALYNILIDKYKNMVFTLAYNIILNKEDAEELAQDVFVKAYHSLQSYKGLASFSTWLYRIVINTSLNKRKLKKLQLVADEEEMIDDVYNDKNALLKQHENSDLKKFIQLAMQTLKVNERLCITLFYLNELSVDEVHELTGISETNIKVLLHRGRKNLYTQLNVLLKNEIIYLI